MKRRFTKDGMGRGEFIKKYESKSPKNLAELLFSAENDLRKAEEEMSRMRSDAGEAELLRTANKNLYKILKDAGIKPHKYEVVTEYCECGDEDESWHCPAQDGCECWDPKETIETFYFWDYSVNDGDLSAIDGEFQSIYLTIVRIVDVDTGRIIWERKAEE